MMSIRRCSICCLSVVLFCMGLAGAASAAPVPAMITPGGVSDFATVADSSTVRMNGQMTLEAWVYPTAWRSYSGREKHGLNFMYKGQIGTHIDYMFTLQANGFLCYGNTQGTIGILRPVVPLNQWTHVAVAINEAAGEIRFYVNGVDQGGYGTWGGWVDRFNPILPSTKPLYLGGFNQLGWGFNNDNFIGKVADMRVWNVARTASQIQDNYRKQLRGEETGLSAYWNMTDNTDKTGHGNNMVRTGSCTLQAGQGPDLQSPGGISVSLTQPTNGQFFSQGDVVSMVATSIGTTVVSKVEFFQGDTKVGEDTTAPFTNAWTATLPGVYQLSARATNAAGESGTSASVLIRVRGPFGGTPWALPGVIEAENYDEGGAGAAYFDTTAANEGGAYRLLEQVDIAAQAGTSNGNVVGWTKAGEWMEYTVNVTTPGTYLVRTRVASGGAGGTFHLKRNGTNVTGTLTVPNTGSWSAYQWVGQVVDLEAGQQKFRLAMDANGASGFVGNFDCIQVMTYVPPSQDPYLGSPVSLPGVVEAENFDTGGQGVAYSDTTPQNEGGQYRLDEAVDIAADAGASNGYLVGWTRAGEWMEYAVDVTSPGFYLLNARVAVNGGGGTFHVEFKGTNLTGTMTVPNTGGWLTYRWISQVVKLTEGPQVMRVAMDAAGSSGVIGNFDCIQLTPYTPPSQDPYLGSPVDLPGEVEVENFDTGGQDVAYMDTTPANEGGQYRLDEAVDIAADASASNGYVVGWVRTGEWMEYTVNVINPGTHTLLIRVASPEVGGTFRILFDGEDKTGPLQVPSSGAWSQYRWVKKTVVLASGQQMLRMEMLSQGSRGFVGNFDQIRVVAGVAGAPYLGSPVALPGLIEAENFDSAGAGVSYYDTTLANLGASYRLAESVDIAPITGGGFLVGWTKAGEWMDYTVHVGTPGTYSIETRLANLGAGGEFRIEVDGQDVTGDLDVPNTSGWLDFTNVTKTGVALTAGEHMVRVVMLTETARGVAGNFDSFRFILETPPPPRSVQVSDDSLVVVEQGPVLADVLSSEDTLEEKPGWAVVDGDSKTVWAGREEAQGWWLTLAYDQDREISALEVVQAGEQPAPVQVLGSTDALSWVEVNLEQGPVTASYLWFIFPRVEDGLAPVVSEIVVK